MYPCATSNPLSLLRFFVACAVLLLGVVKVGYGQRVYADAQSIQSDSNPTYTPIKNISSGAVDPNQAGYTQWTAPGGLTAGYRDLTLMFPSLASPNQIVFVKVDDWKNITIGTAINNLSSGLQITGPDGSKYVSISPNVAFNSIVIRNTGTLLGGSSTRRVFNAFFEPQQHTNCVAALATSKNVSGLLPISADVENIPYAIDGDLSTNSRFFIAVGVAATVSQTIYFSNLSNPGDAATVTISVNPTLLSLGLLGNTTINLYNDTQLVGGESLSGLLQGTDLLGLLQTGEPATFSFVPEGAPVVFDRITISMSSLAGVLTSLNVHEVQRTPAKPVLPNTYPVVIEACDGEPLLVNIESPSDGSVLRWYDENGAHLEVIESTDNPDEYNYLYSGPGEYKISVASAWGSECFAESERIKLTLIVHPKPPTPDIDIM